MPPNLPGILLAALLFSLSCGTSEDEVSSASNGVKAPIILIDIDTLRADHLGYHGYGRDTSPNIDALAASSTRFEWAFAQAPNTPPSQCSILTGLYPTRHGRIQNEHALPDTVTTLAEALSAGGYATAAFVDGGYMAAGFGTEQGFDVYNDEAGGLEQIGPRVTRWLDGNASKGRPFLLLIHTYDVHSPYDSPPGPFKLMYTKGLELPSAEFRKKFGDEMIRVWEGRESANPPSLEKAEIEYIKALYDGGIRYVDTWLGNFLADLKERSIYDEAVIVFLSDHGEEFLDHKGVLHDKIFSPVARIPFLLKLPHQQKGIVIDDAVESIDLVPSLLDIVGLSPIDDIDGTSLVPIISGGRSGSPELAISESPFYGRRIGIATDRYRLLTSLNQDRTQLFEYRKDPREQNDIAARNPKLVAEMISAAKQWHVLVAENTHPEKNAEWLKQTTIDQLEALGYIEP